jgi:uncharacterized protein
MFRRCLFIGFCLAWAGLAGSETRLADAAMAGDRETVHSLLKQNVDVNAAQGDGSTALHWAAFQDDIEMAQWLIRAGANVKAATRINGMTPLFLACRNGSSRMVEILLQAGADANQPDTLGTTPLMIAAAAGNPDAVKVLIEHGAGVNAKESAHGQTALMFAAALNRAAAIQVLMAHGADAKVTTKVVKPERVRVDEEGKPVLDEKEPAGAGRGGRGGARTAESSKPTPEVAELKAQIQKLTAELNELKPGDKKQESANSKQENASDTKEAGRVKEQTASAGKSPADAKADPKTADANDPKKRPRREVGAQVVGGMTALLFAARDGQVDAARSLLDAGVDINDPGNGEKMTPLVMAISNGHFDLAKMLLDRGANPNLANIEGLTALWDTVDVQWSPHAWFPEPVVAQEHVGYLELMSDLLAHGADPNAKLEKKAWFRTTSHDATWVDPAGTTAFWRAAQANDLAAMRLLVKAGADPKIASKDGVTPLMVAAGLGWAANFSVNATDSVLESVKFCLEAGDDVQAADAKGETALHGAAYIGNNELVKLLVGKGAKVDVKTKAGDTVADMANGPTRFGIPHPETVALLEKLGSPNSHNCRSDQCLVAPKEDKRPAAKDDKKPGEGKPEGKEAAPVTTVAKPGV